MSKSAALSTRVKHLCTCQSIDLKVDTLHPQLYLLTPSQPNQKLFSYLPNINRKWNVTTAVFLNSNFDAMAYLPFDKTVTAKRLVKAAIMTNTTMVTLFVPTGQTGLTPNAFQTLREQLQHYQLQLLDQITYTGSYNDELACQQLLTKV